MPKQTHEFTLSYYIAITASQLKVDLHKRLNSKGINITPEQLAVLSLLQKQSDCVSMKFISKGTFRDNSAVTRIIDNLEKKKYLERKPSSTDKRIKLICISTLGRETFSEATIIIKQHVRHALKGMEENEQEIMFRLLELIQNNLIANF